MKVALKTLVALTLLWLLARLIDVKVLAAALSNVEGTSIIISSFLFLAAWALAAIKWRVLWPRASWHELFLANLSSQFYSLVLPGQVAGEVVKTIRVGQRFSDTVGVAASVLVDRVTGVVGLLLLACLGAFVSSSEPAAKVRCLLVVAFVVVAAALLFFEIPRLRSATDALLLRAAANRSFLGQTAAVFERFLAAWSKLAGRPRVAVAAVALGAAFQLLSVGINFVVAKGLGIEVALFDWCWILGAVSIALLLPITIAGIGVREGAYVGTLGLLGVQTEKALAVSILVFGISLIGVLAGAVVELGSALSGRQSDSRERKKPLKGR